MNGTPPAAPVILAMLKAPRAGFVKTRLAREIGAVAAAGVYRRLVEHQMTALPRGWPIEIHTAPADAIPEMQTWLGVERACFPQAGGDLGARLIHATESAFARHGRPMIVIGGDCPGLGAMILDAARAALRTTDVALGPAVDGGYYLIGLQRPRRELFRGIPWSSESVLKTTLERVRETGLRSSLLPVLEDVDDLTSWRRVQKLLPAAHPAPTIAASDAILP